MLKTLIIENNEACKKIISLFFEYEGLQVEIVGDINQAILIVDLSIYSHLVVNIIPSYLEDDIEYGKIQELIGKFEGRAFATTACVLPDDRTKISSFGFLDVIEKPFKKGNFLPIFEKIRQFTN